MFSMRGRLAAGACAGAVVVFALAAWLLGGHAPAGAAGQAPEARPNVVVVMSDDQTVEQQQALERVRTEIAVPGTTFERNYAVYPLCCPSRSTYLTGQYPHNHGVLGNKPPEGGYYKLDSTNTLPVWMSAAGYATAHIGKYLNGYGTRNPREVPPGWQSWQGAVDPTTYNYMRYCLNENGTLVSYGTNAAIEKACPGAVRRPASYQTDAYTAKAVDYIDGAAPSAQPFFLSVAYLAPHSGGPNPANGRCRGSAKPAERHRRAFAGATLPRPPGFNEPDVSDKPPFIRRLPRLSRDGVQQIARDYRCRRESLLAVDEGVGQIMAALQRSGELDNTLVIFTSDNGFFQGEHRVPRGKIKVYEPSVRVPAVMRGPGVPRGRSVQTLTANIDLAATIVDVAGATPGRVLDGVSLRAIAQRPGTFAGRGLLLESGPGNGPGNPRYSALRTGRWKYVEYVTGPRELYDLRTDPFERRNVYAIKREARTGLARQLAALRGCAGAACR
jgi:N-acetylglucosamine-6-sulfatase